MRFMESILNSTVAIDQHGGPFRYSAKHFAIGMAYGKTDAYSSSCPASSPCASYLFGCIFLDSERSG